MGKNFRETLAKELENVEFQKEWDCLEPQYAMIREMIRIRNEKNITQKELSARTGIARADISKLESGNANPSIKTLVRIAAGMGKELHIAFK